MDSIGVRSEDLSPQSIAEVTSDALKETSSNSMMYTVSNKEFVWITGCKKRHEHQTVVHKLKSNHKSQPGSRMSCSVERNRFNPARLCGLNEHFIGGNGRTRSKIFRTIGDSGQFFVSEQKLFTPPTMQEQS